MNKLEMHIIANWKQNKTLADLKDWLTGFDSIFDKEKVGQVEIVVAPSFPLIVPLKMIAQEVGYLKISSQDISEYKDGAHTGEVGASQLQGLAEYSIIGHSERRKNGETIDQVNSKITNALELGIKPIVCFSIEEEASAVIEKHGKDAVLFAFEPVSAISSTENSSGPAGVEEIKAMVDKLPIDKVIYGGSVDKSNVDNYLNIQFISGFLVGSASLDPANFAEIANKLH